MGHQGVAWIGPFDEYRARGWVHSTPVDDGREAILVLDLVTEAILGLKSDFRPGCTLKAGGFSAENA